MIWVLVGVFFIQTCWSSVALAQAHVSAVSQAQSIVDLHPVGLKGVMLDPTSPLAFDFLIDPANPLLDSGFQPPDKDHQQIKINSQKLVKYFFAALTIPDDDFWVNLSPAEEDRVIPDSLAYTEMGRVMLAQDYLLKQLTSTMLHPDHDIGKRFWKKIYAKAYEQYGVTDIPMDTFHKVWITPAYAKVYQKEWKAYIVDARMKVMLEHDYLNHNIRQSVGSRIFGNPQQHPETLTTNVMRSIVIPALEDEVNEGEAFAPLREIYHAMILAAWFKQKLKNTSTYMDRVFIDQQKISGVDHSNPMMKEELYSRYLSSVREGVVDMIREEYDSLTRTFVPRHYFSGGESFQRIPIEYVSHISADFVMVAKANITPKKKSERSLYQTINLPLTVLFIDGDRIETWKKKHSWLWKKLNVIYKAASRNPGEFYSDSIDFKKDDARDWLASIESEGLLLPNESLAQFDFGKKMGVAESLLVEVEFPIADDTVDDDAAMNPATVFVTLVSSQGLVQRKFVFDGLQWSSGKSLQFNNEHDFTQYIGAPVLVGLEEQESIDKVKENKSGEKSDLIEGEKEARVGRLIGHQPEKNTGDAVRELADDSSKNQNAKSESEVSSVSLDHKSEGFITTTITGRQPIAEKIWDMHLYIDAISLEMIRGLANNNVIHQHNRHNDPDFSALETKFQQLVSSRPKSVVLGEGYQNPKEIKKLYDFYRQVVEKDLPQIVSLFENIVSKYHLEELPFVLKVRQEVTKATTYLDAAIKGEFDLRDVDINKILLITVRLMSSKSKWLDGFSDQVELNVNTSGLEDGGSKKVFTSLFHTQWVMYQVVRLFGLYFNDPANAAMLIDVDIDYTTEFVSVTFAIDTDNDAISTLMGDDLYVLAEMKRVMRQLGGSFVYNSSRDGQVVMELQFVRQPASSPLQYPPVLAQPKDEYMLAKGGVDFNPTVLDLIVESSGVSNDTAMLSWMGLDLPDNIDGFIPQVISVSAAQPATQLLQ